MKITLHRSRTPGLYNNSKNNNHKQYFALILARNKFCKIFWSLMIRAEGPPMPAIFCHKQNKNKIKMWRGAG